MTWFVRLVRRNRLERHLDAELRDHLDRQVAENMRKGIDQAEARRLALLAIGGLEPLKEKCREARGTLWLEQIGRDVVYAVGQFRRQPGFWSIVIATLALGIAMSTTIFAVVDGVLLRSLSYPSPDRLVSLGALGYRGEFVQLRERSRTLEIGAFMDRAPVSLTGRGEPERLDAELASAEFFDVLGVTPRLGRRLQQEDTKPGAAPVTVLSDGLWQQRFGGDRRIIGQQLLLDGRGYTVVGIMPASFRFPAGVRLWLPFVINPADRIDLWAGGAVMIGRLRPGVRLDDARREIRTLTPTFRELFPWKMPADYGKNATVIPLQDRVIGDVRPTLIVLLGSVVTVLLILCVNVANLLLTRGLARDRELSIRAAIGATRRRLLSQLLIESLTVSVIAGLLGVAAGFVLLNVTLTMLPTDVPRLSEIAIDVRVMTFALGLSILTGLVFGMLPAIRASRSEHAAALHAARSSVLQPSERRSSKILVTAECALALLLVVGAGLLIRSVRNLVAVYPGFRVEQLVTATIAPPRARYNRLQSYRQFVDELLERVKASSGVQGAAAGNMAPFAGRQFGAVFSIEGRPDPATQSGDWPTADVRTFVTPDYLRVLGVPLLDGREVSVSDTFEAPRVAVLSRSLARAYWGDASPVGARIRFPGGPNAPWVTVIGVVGDIKWNNLNEERNWASGAPAAGWLRTLYVPFAQASVIDNNGVRLLVRSRTNPGEIAANLGALVRSIDADTPVSDIRTTDALIGASVARPRFTAVLLTIFAGVGLLLGAIGVYGLVAYAVERRTQEFAVRLALGAEPRKLLRSVIADGTRLAVAGVLVGLMIATLATRTLSTLLFGVTPTDAGTLAGAALLLISIAIVASYIPARRAMRIDPSTALQRQ